MSAHPDSAFIVFEGIDGAGTTTQAGLLVEELRRRQPDREIVQTREPWDHALTKRIRSWLAEENPPWEALLHAFVLDRHVHLRELVEPALERGAIVVCDRYKLSTLVYQPMNNPLDLVERLIASAREPDLYLLLDVDVEAAAMRLAARSSTRDAYERNLETQRTVAEGYRKAAARYGDRTVHMKVTDQSIMEVSDAVVEHVCGRFQIT